jgi:hypothetical protein
MDTTIRRLRSEAQQLARGKAPRTIRYPARFRSAAVQVARAHVAEGRALAEVAHAVGVSAPSLQHWLERETALGLRPVAIERAGRETREGSGPVLITPQGVRVEGLDRDALIVVLRALA